MQNHNFSDPRCRSADTKQSVLHRPDDLGGEQRGSNSFLITVLVDREPKLREEVSLKDLIGVAQAVEWSPIDWDRDNKGRWRRRKTAFRSSSLVVVDLDAKSPFWRKDPWDGDITALIAKLDTLGYRGFLLAGRREGNCTLVLVPERPMVTEQEHRLTHLTYCDQFGGDRACCDAVDYYNPRHVPERNPTSGRVLWSNFHGMKVGLTLRLPTADTAISERSVDQAAQAVDCPFDGTLEDVVSYLRFSAPPAVTGTGIRDSRRFSVVVEAGARLNAIGELTVERLADLIQRHYAPRCNPVITEVDVRRMTKTVTGWATQGTLRSPKTGSAKPAPVKHLRSACACGCGVSLEQVPGKGRPRRWATQSCRMKAQRRIQKLRLTPVTGAVEAVLHHAVEIVEKIKTPSHGEKPRLSPVSHHGKQSKNRDRRMEAAASVSTVDEPTDVVGGAHERGADDL